VLKPDHLKLLSPTQYEAATAQGNCLVVACPGAGKTGMLAARAVNLLLQGKSVTAVTFTRDGAIELRERILSKIPESARARLLTGTFHSLCMFMAFPSARKTPIGAEILRQQRSPFREKWAIAGDGERSTCAIAAADEAGLDAKAEDVLRIIESIKSGESAKSQAEAQAAALYDRAMARQGKIDYQDIINNVVRALADGSMSTLRTNHLLVDEFQDTDEKQYAWILAHLKAGTFVTAVGDDDQSIYQFRRAMGYKAMVSFAQDGGSEMVKLEDNYRSHAEILAPAQRLIDQSRNRMPKVLKSYKGNGGSVQAYAFVTRDDEAQAIATAAKEHLEVGRSFAVLTRNNLRLDAVEAALAIKGVPYTRAEGVSLLKSPEAEAMMDAIDCLKGDDIEARNHVLLWAGIDGGSLEALNRLFGGALVEARPDDFKNQGASDEAVAVWRSYAKLSKQWARLEANGLGALALQGIGTWLRDRAKSVYSKKTMELCEAMLEPAEGESLMASARKLRGAAKAPKQDMHASKGAKLMTAHGSKGLEFDAVWLAGAEDGVWPDKKSAIDEERRLFYVAMTRARWWLTISCESNRVKPSPFIVDAGLNLENGSIN